MISAPERLASEALLAPKTEFRRLGDVHAPWLWLVLILLSGLVFAGVLYITRYLSFFYDEWDFISWFRPPQPTSIWLPHNEHWSTLPILAWKLLFILFGIRSHVPYEAALLAVHIASVFLLFALIRRRSGDLVAFASALTLLVLGSGGSDIVWAFQIGFVGSVAFGLLAMLLLDGTRPFASRALAGSAALLCSLMCSGIGLAFLAAVGVELSVDRTRRRFLLALVAPIAAYVVWFLKFGAGVPGSPGLAADFLNGRIGLGYFASLANFVTAGLQASVSGVFGWAGVGAALLPIIAAILALHWYRHGRVESWQIGMTAGVLAQFSLIGLVRAQLGTAAATDSHYVYVGAVFLLPLIADAARDVAWEPRWRGALVAAFALSLFGNTTQLLDVAGSQVDTMRSQAAELRTVEVFREAPDMALYRPLDDKIMPQLVPARYFAATDELGSPVFPATLDTLQQLPGQTVDRVMLNLFGEALSVKSDGMQPAQGLPCRNVDTTVPSTLDFRVTNGQPLILQSSDGGDASLFLWFLGPPPSEPLQHVQLHPATPARIHLPDVGKPAVWHLRVKTTAMGLLRVCGVPSLQLQQTVNYVYQGQAASGALGPGWSSLLDSATFSGYAAKAAIGSVSRKNKVYGTDTFGAPFVPSPGAYDVWFHVRVTSPKGSAAEMTLGLWDDTGVVWRGSTIYQAKQVGTSYSWVKVAAGVRPLAGHLVQFQAYVTAKLSTDWYVDEAVIQPASAPRPKG